ncbi:SGNH/GDSL hydrolase family protein [Variovorax sp. JS1663]|uniref:SGNH/GDSL hydrolase family protein n=1 Tax=Variovorax sp. JS1663 TaxID=1851577 RepID=UPI000B347F84|nr:SGNH/GDSL hydrolase family protein [Variovorax sp. JS1663]OUM01646.1 hypothetical protein A8M77_15345 [Variovorax sp. JS1663]
MAWLDLILASRLFGWLFGDMHGRDEREDATPARVVASAFAIAVLSGCGGGGGGGGGGGPIATLPAPTHQNPQPEQPIKPPPVCSVWLEGDSILHGSTFGAGRLTEPPAAAIKRMRPMYTVTDRSQPGAYVNLRMPGFLTELLDARFIVIEFGINDGGNGFDYKEPLRAMVQRAKGLGRTPVVTGLSRVRGAPPWRDAYDDLARQVAAEEGAIFADWGAAAFDPADMADDVHPGQAYSTRLVEQLVRALDKAAPECNA